MAKPTGNSRPHKAATKSVARRTQAENALYQGTIRGPKVRHESRFVSAAVATAHARATAALARARKGGAARGADGKV